MERFAKMQLAREFRHQAGVVLFASLIVLIIVTLAVLSTIRRVDNANMLAGSLAFRQSALASTEQGFDASYRLLLGLPTTSLIGNGTGNGYMASASSLDVDWHGNAVWANASPQVIDALGNTRQFLVERLCSNGGDPNTVLTIRCARAGSGVVPASLMEHTQDAFEPPVTAPIIYRITVRVQGPRNVTSIAQAYVTN